MVDLQKGMNKQRQEIEFLTLSLGKILLNLLELEMFARIFIESRKNPDISKREGISLPNIQLDSIVERNLLTGIEPLGAILDRYNRECSIKYQVERDKIVFLRNALAHGRVFGEGEMGNPSFKLLKFKKLNNEDKNMVKVECATYMDRTWLNDKVNFVNEEINKIREAVSEIHPWVKVEF